MALAGRIELRTVLLSVAALGLGVAATVLVVRFAERQRSEPSRCPPGLVALGPRCCGEGQYLSRGHCLGQPRRCAARLIRAEGQIEGCVPIERRVELKGAVFDLPAADWEAEGQIEPRRARIAPFAIDATEATVDRWQSCVAAGACRTLANHELIEPGRPITGVTPDEGARFCSFYGGRLPTTDEWLHASRMQRYPWGQTGLVCRRAVFGLVDGPCAHGATGPEVPGSRPDGASREGVLDLVGNVAEWTVEPSGQHVARGGSYRSRVAAELHPWSSEILRAPRADVGFRCVYDLPQPATTGATR